MAEVPQVIFGRLEAVSVRQAWPREDTAFTPWLAREENLELLSSELGMTLEVIEVECNVGMYRADILARHVDTQEHVIIENQFGKTDHSHLGQALTYAAGLGGSGSGARAVIWIAEEFTEPHRAALDWLNQVTDPSIGFFGIELQLWRIGTSALAPKFNIISRPNSFQKEITRQATALSESEKLYQDFWSAFIDFCGDDTKLSMPSAPPRYWLPTVIGRSGVGINLVVGRRNKRMECQVWLDGSNAQSIYDSLLARRQE